MKYVYLVCGKDNAQAYNFWIVLVTTSEKAAKKWVKQLDEDNKDIYHYYFKEPIIK